MRSFSLNEFLFIVNALQWTVAISLIAFALGGTLGSVVAVLRVSKLGAVRLAAAGYVKLFQGTPLLMQLFLVYYGLGLFGSMNVSSGFALAVFIYLAQAVFSAWSLRRFRFGPVEWLWRTLIGRRSDKLRGRRPLPAGSHRATGRHCSAESSRWRRGRASSWPCFTRSP